MRGRQRAICRTLALQSGAALILCLLLLSALSLLGLSAATEHQMQFRMSQNLAAGNQRRFSAEHALNWAEDWLLGLPGTNRPGTCSTDCLPLEIIRPKGALGPAPQHQDLAWWQANGHAAGYVPGTDPQGFDGPWYVVEEVYLEPSSDPESHLQETAYYKILARSSGTTDTQSSVTESVLARPWGHESLSNGFPPGPDIRSFCITGHIDTPCGRVAWRTLKS